MRIVTPGVDLREFVKVPNKSRPFGSLSTVHAGLKISYGQSHTLPKASEPICKPKI